MKDLVIVLFNDGTRFQTEINQPGPREWTDVVAAVGDVVKSRRDEVSGCVYIGVDNYVSQYSANEAREILFGE